MRLIKADDAKFFVFSESPTAILIVALRIKALFLSDAQLASVFVVKGIGLAYGPTVLLTADLFGDSVNVSSKLGEDTATNGQVLWPCGNRTAS